MTALVTITTRSGPVILDWGESAMSITVRSKEGAIGLGWVGAVNRITGAHDAKQWWEMAVEDGLHGPFGHTIELQAVTLCDLVFAINDKIRLGFLEAVAVDQPVPRLNYPPADACS